MLLLEHGVDLNLRDNEGRTPLSLATLCLPDQTLLRLLLDYGANRDEIDKDGWTPLHFACKRGTLCIVKCLLEYRPGS